MAEGQLSGIMVRVEHMRQAELCARGGKVWAERNGLDFRHFIMHGYPVETIEAVNDAFAKKLANVAREDAEGR